jgi:hypothetical protein
MSKAGETLIEIVRKYIGCSLHIRKDDLADLICRGVDDPAQSVLIKTNCGMFALGVMCEAGVAHDLLSQKYKSGMAIAWVRSIGKDMKALQKYSKTNVPPAGALLHYYTAGKNDNHVEWLLSDIDDQGCAEHGGGGRTDNAITVGTGNVLWNYGRPLQEWLDPEMLLPGL